MYWKLGHILEGMGMREESEVRVSGRVGCVCLCVAK